MNKRPMCLPKQKKKQKEKEKEKEKGKENRKVATLCLETLAQSEEYMAKAFKARCPKPTSWESPT